MPRRTEADRAAASAARFEDDLAKAHAAYADDESQIAAPLGKAYEWLTAALARRHRAGKNDAASFYREATVQISAYARDIDAKTASGK